MLQKPIEPISISTISGGPSAFSFGMDRKLIPNLATSSNTNSKTNHYLSLKLLYIWRIFWWISQFDRIIIFSRVPTPFEFHLHFGWVWKRFFGLFSWIPEICRDHVKIFVSGWRRSQWLTIERRFLKDGRKQPHNSNKKNKALPQQLKLTECNNNLKFYSNDHEFHFHIVGSVDDA